jgi:hypothetical protein
MSYVVVFAAPGQSHVNMLAHLSSSDLGETRCSDISQNRLEMVRNEIYLKLAND